MIISNFHTHTLFCDGADTPEELIKEAIEKGFKALGFSGHRYCESEKSYAMSPENEKIYFSQINDLKDKYKDKIKIYCGIEQDIFCETDNSMYDYVIGSVHSIFKNGEYYPVDESALITEKIVNDLFYGNFDAFAYEYFSLVSNVVEKTNADIIGHFDLILKFAERLNYTPSKRFLEYAEDTVKKLAKYGKVFEINTGAMARGVRTVPYPITEILKIINAQNGRVIITSDCHRKEKLAFGFDTAYKLATDCGFSADRISYSLF